MRSRRSAYSHSSAFRHDYNGVTQHEPVTIDEIPA
jgi:hypothetical protein